MATIRAIKDYYQLFQNVNELLDQTIRQENNIINESVEVNNLDFGDYPRENEELDFCRKF